MRVQPSDASVRGLVQKVVGIFPNAYTLLAKFKVNSRCGKSTRSACELPP
jgi:hypothetical protein